MKIYKPSDSRDPCDICGGQPMNENQNVIIVNAVSLLSRPGQNGGLLSKPDDDVDNFSHICHECITAMLDVVRDKTGMASYELHDEDVVTRTEDDKLN